MCAVSARAGGVLAASDMEGLIRPGVAVVVGDREGAVDGQIAPCVMFQSLPVMSRVGMSLVPWMATVTVFAVHALCSSRT